MNKINNQKPAILQATPAQAFAIHELVRRTTQEIYSKYYRDEVVKFFVELHSQEAIAEEIAQGIVYVLVLDETIIGTGTVKENHVTRVYVLPEYQGKGMGSMIMDFLEDMIVKNDGSVWIDASLPAGGFYHKRGYVTREYQEYPLENDKVLAYEVMCKNRFKIDPKEFDAPNQLVRRELELGGYDIDKIAIPKRVYLLADSLYDTMLSRNAGTLTYPLGGDLYVMNNNKQVGFVKGEMCAPGIATQAEDLIAGGVRELIHVGFAGGANGCRIGDIVVTDGAYNNTGVAGLYGFHEELIASSKTLTDEVCEELASKGVSYIRGTHWTTDAGYVQPRWRAKEFEDKGALCVEMEGAGLFTVAVFRSCHATGIYVISDTVSNDEWNLGWGEDALEKSIDRIIDAIVE